MALIHRWPLTENVNNVIGVGNLTNTGGVGFSENGALITNSPGIAWLSSVLSPPDGPFTFSLWLKPTAWSCSGVIANDFGWRVAHDATGCGFEIYNNLVTVQHGGGRDESLPFNESNFPSNTHTLLSLAYNGTNVVGRRNNSTICTFASGYTVTTTGFQLGDNTHVRIPMYVCDVRIHNHALSQSEIDALVAAGPNGTGGYARIPTPLILSTMPAALTRGFR